MPNDPFRQNPNQDPEQKGDPNRKKKKSIFTIIIAALIFTVVINMVYTAITGAYKKQIPYNEFMELLLTDQLEEVAFEDNAFSTNNSSSSSLGHAFIVVTNLTTTNLTVGLMTVAPGESVSIGTYPDDSAFGSNSSYDRGIWYNREMYGNNGGVCGAYGNATSIDTYLTQTELNSLNGFVRDSSNDSWDLFNNCSRFAARAWNVVGEFELSAGWPCTPAYLVNNIRTHNGYNTYDPLGSYNGRRAYVKNGALIYE